MSDSSHLWQRVEGLAFLGVFGFAYHHSGFSWLLYVLVFFLPDVSIAAYKWGNETGAQAYNFCHNYAVPIALGSVGYFAQNATCIAIGLIWASHIGFDRLFGYGLKLNSGFNHTHLGNVGRAKE